MTHSNEIRSVEDVVRNIKLFTERHNRNEWSDEMRKSITALLKHAQGKIKKGKISGAISDFAQGYNAAKDEDIAILQAIIDGS
jgi:hypothetical protein